MMIAASGVRECHGCGEMAQTVWINHAPDGYTPKSWYDESTRQLRLCMQCLRMMLGSGWNDVDIERDDDDDSVTYGDDGVARVRIR